MDYISIIMLVGVFAAGYAVCHYKTEIERWYANKKRRAFFRVIMQYDSRNTSGVESMVNGVLPVETTINADFNEEFIQRIDSYYISKGDAEYNPMADNNEKVLLYIYDIVSSIAEPILGDEGEDPLSDDIDNIPPLAFRGGMENKTVVDLTHPTDPDNPIKTDFYGG